MHEIVWRSDMDDVVIGAVPDGAVLILKKTVLVCVQRWQAIGATQMYPMTSSSLLGVSHIEPVCRTAPDPPAMVDGKEVG